MAFNSGSGSTVVTGNVSLDTTPTPVNSDTTTGTATTRTDTYTVPANKQWKVKVISVGRSNSGLNTFYATIDSNDVFLVNETNTRSMVNNLDLNLKAGDDIRIVIGAAASGVIISAIAYEEISV